MQAVYGFPESEAAAGRLAARLALPCRVVSLHRFPDGESLVRVDPPALSAILYRSLDRPNDKLIEILLAASALRDGGCEEITLVAPYMAYMRQDIAFHSGEAVSQKVVGKLLAGAMDRVATVNPHLHRTPTIDAVFPGIAAIAIDAAPAIAALLATEGIARDTVVIGPDEESRPWARALAEPLGLPVITATKERRGDRDVTVSLPETPTLAGRPVLLLDDVVSTGGTLAACARAARAAGAGRIEAFVVHALCDEQTMRGLAAAGIDRLRSCDGVPHPSNALHLADLLAAALGGPRARAR